MKTSKTSFLCTFVFCALLSAQAQGTFQNLGFESANLTPVPSGQGGSLVPISDALPSWTGYIGTNQLTTVLQNSLTLGNASIDILGPDWIGNGIIEGEYSVILQPSFDPFGSSQNVSASISQSALVPADALSLQFKAQTYSSFTVSLGGQMLSLIPLGTGSNYTLYGADISSFAGQPQPETLTITALAAPNTVDYFDSFVFSPLSVPEPSIFGLFALGGLFFGLRRWCTSRQ